jgi:hypothetical protein
VYNNILATFIHFCGNLGRRNSNSKQGNCYKKDHFRGLITVDWTCLHKRTIDLEKLRIQLNIISFLNNSQNSPKKCLKRYYNCNFIAVQCMYIAQKIPQIIGWRSHSKQHNFTAKHSWCSSIYTCSSIPSSAKGKL